MRRDSEEVLGERLFAKAFEKTVKVMPQRDLTIELLRLNLP